MGVGTEEVDLSITDVDFQSASEMLTSKATALRRHWRKVTICFVQTSFEVDQTRIVVYLIKLETNPFGDCYQYCFHWNFHNFQIVLLRNAQPSCFTDYMRCDVPQYSINLSIYLKRLRADPSLVPKPPRKMLGNYM